MGVLWTAREELSEKINQLISTSETISNHPDAAPTLQYVHEKREPVFVMLRVRVFVIGDRDFSEPTALKYSDSDRQIVSGRWRN